MPNLNKLISVMAEARGLLASEDNNFDWSSWEDRNAALAEIDEILIQLRQGAVLVTHTLGVLFAPTGPIQEVSLSSGWGDTFIALANQFDEAMAQENGNADQVGHNGIDGHCRCLESPIGQGASNTELGMDSRFGDVSVFRCPDCGRNWLRYYYEVEAFSGSGRWYLGAVTPKQLAELTVENAKSTIEMLDWYYYGGSYFDGLSGRSSGEILLSP